MDHRRSNWSRAARAACAALVSAAAAGCGGSDLPEDLAGTLAYVSDRDGRDAIYLRRLPDGDDVLLVSQIEPLGSPALSPSGLEVAFTMRGRLGVASVETRAVRFLTHGVDWRDESPSWRPDGRALVVSARPSEGAPADLHLIPLSASPGGESRQRLTRTPHEETEAVFTPLGTAIVYVREQRLFRLDVASGQTRPLTKGFRAMRSPRFLPDGRLVAAWTQDKRFGIDLLGADGETRETLAQGTDYYRTVAPSPDGRYMAAALAFQTDALRLRQNERVVLLDARGRRLGTLASAWRRACGAPSWGR
jgi:Tol biopolymer transport system component